jgi:hypothetical protein
MNTNYSIIKVATGLWELKIGSEVVGTIATLNGDGAIANNGIRTYQVSFKNNFPAAETGTLGHCKKFANFWLAQMAR